MSSLLKRKDVLAASKPSSGGGSSAYQNKVLADGALAYWPLDDVAGTTARELVSAKNGTISGGVTLNVAGVSTNKAMTFNGTTGKIVTGSVTIPAICTIEGWIKTGSVGTPHKPYISTRLTGTTGDPIYLGVTIAPVTIFAFYGSSVVSVKLVGDSIWHQCVVTHDTWTATIYIDGVFDAALSAIARNNSTVGPLSIGFDEPTTFYWPSSIADISIYPRMLTPAEITAHYSAR
jgi:hypothetical protein